MTLVGLWQVLRQRHYCEKSRDPPNYVLINVLALRPDRDSHLRRLQIAVFSRHVTSTLLKSSLRSRQDFGCHCHVGESPVYLRCFGPLTIGASKYSLVHPSFRLRPSVWTLCRRMPFAQWVVPLRLFNDEKEKKEDKLRALTYRELVVRAYRFFSLLSASY